MPFSGIQGTSDLRIYTKAKGNKNMDTKEKKELGNWGEKTLDEWMKKNSWNAVNKNLKIKKGEIDRVYFHKNSESGKIQFCVTEVKTSHFYTTKDIEILFTETGVKRYLKQRQIQNLYKYGENIIAHLKQQKIPNFKVYLRFFIILKSKYPLKKINSKNLPKSPAIKNCVQGDDFYIFSIEPEFTGINARKGLLQVKIW